MDAKEGRTTLGSNIAPGGPDRESRVQSAGRRVGRPRLPALNLPRMTTPAVHPLEELIMNKRIRKKRVRQILLAELAAAFGEPAEAIRWLETAHPQLEGRSPREALAAGETERVTLVLDGENRSR
jgi:hypothetical protein